MRRSLRVAVGACLVCGLAVGAAAPTALAQAPTVDLGVALSDNPDPVRTGQAVTYRVAVANAGPDTARSVRLVNTISPAVDFLAASSGQATCGRQKRRVICSMGSLGPGRAKVVNVRVRPTLDRPRYGILNVATVGKRKTDSNPANNTTREHTLVENPPPVICAGRAANVVGTNGDDALFGTEGPDVIAALSGNDDVVGLGGNDIVCSSGGRDKVRGGAGADRLKGGGGNDKLRGGGGNDRLQGKAGRDKLRGGRGNDLLRGGHGSDRCRGGGGTDIKRSC